MKPKTKRKTPEKPKRNTRDITNKTLKRRENASLIKTIDKYEKNFTDLITKSYEVSPLFLSTLLFISLYPQLQNSKNSTPYKEFFKLIQTDEEFKDKVYRGEYPYTDIESELYHYQLYPLLHQRLLEVVRECVNGGYTKKVSNSLLKIASEVSYTGVRK
jgi:hypothetical protein